MIEYLFFLIGASYIAAFELGRNIPSLDMLAKAAVMFDVSLDYFFEYPSGAQVTAMIEALKNTPE